MDDADDTAFVYDDKYLLYFVKVCFYGMNIVDGTDVPAVYGE